MPVAKRNQLVGLDIGSHSIKLVEMTQTRKGRILKNIGLAVLPPKAIVEGVIRESIAVSELLRALFENLKIRNSNVATSLSGYSVILKKISVRRSESIPLEKQIYEEAEQYIPFDVNEVNLDFDILERSETGPGESGLGAQGAEVLDVMLVAAKRKIVEDYVQVLEEAGINPVVLDVDAFAMQNAFELSSKGEDGCYALVNVGAEELGINIVKDGISMFSRDSSFGGSQITELVMAQFGVNFMEAERIKLGGQAVQDVEKLRGIFQKVVENWIREVSRALDFVRTAYPEADIGKIYVCGGSCRIPGFQSYLQKETGLKVAEINPFKNLIVDEKIIDPNYLQSVASQAVIAVGLALRSIGDK